MTPERQFIDAMLAKHFAPRIVVPVDQWADENRVLPRETSAEAGPFRTDRTPYARQIMRDLSDDSPFEDVVLMCATQLVKSETGLNWLGSIIDQTPAPVMVVQATVETGKRYSRQRIASMIRSSKALKGKVRDARERDSGNTLLMKDFPDGALVVTGANSAAGLASMPAQYIHFDERDDYPDDVDGQGDPTKIARARQDTFLRRKRLTSSTPKRAKGRSRIEEEFKAGTRFYYHVACPDCTESFRFEFEGLVMAESGTVRYACPHCGSLIDEHHKTEMLAAGEWIAEDPNAKARSYHLNSLYSPLGWLSWRALVDEYNEALEAQKLGNDAPMKAFLNTRLAKTFEEKTDKLESDDLRERAEDYPLRQVPAMACALTAGVDVQDNRFEVTVYAWAPREESWVVDYTQLHCDPASDSAWQKLDDYLKSTFVAADGRRLPVAAAAIDTGGHFTHQVYAFCRNRKRTFAVKGAERPGLPVKGKSSTVDVNYRGKIIPNGVRLWFVGTDSAKDLLHNRMRMKHEGPGFLHVSDELPDEFFEGMTSEERKRIKTARGMRSTWVKKSSNARNEPLDCTVYALFAAHVLDLPRYTETMWNRLRQRQEKARDAAPEQVEAETQGLPAAPVSAPPATARRVFQPQRSGGFVTRWKQ
jgi:phage terminase large subunit GpA-like protein